ncbi:hypothetical protein M409DRAFT_52490 [Zasmidium cellare ATCC 36951]|uniref:Nuclear pore complex protein Nup85 n=1 Tax=Zasmidium cellare ATCC 36951 TaxID=1080233 RepID=A0A6A6CTW1_ZASCE|nr:uncharacterized protein M409DRAFT_52490 [Zasmidium cellare ATCC 36951]KAF2169219.1 hypothetical protein M409DRAFT_52490 [Zasmidium cellare ATCC 36951]
MPTTPNSRSIRSNIPSTTPAGPPPSWLTQRSTTPDGQPPRSSFNAANNTFGKKTASFEVPDQDDDDYDFDQYGEEDAEGEVDDTMDLLMDAGAYSTMKSSLPAPRSRGVKRSLEEDTRDRPTAKIARGMTGGRKPAELKETDIIVVQSERIVGDLGSRLQRQPAQREVILTDTAAQLTKLWRQEAKIETKSGGIGPDASDGFSKANYVANLLLQLHHPHSSKASKALARQARSTPLDTASSSAVPVPRALIDWLETYHVPFPDDFDNIFQNSPSPSAHESFWDIVFASLLRGKLRQAIRLLKDAGWRYAATAREDERRDQEYNDQQVYNIELAVRDVLEVLESCPGYKYDDWDGKGMDWTIFRQRAGAKLADLEDFAEGDGSNFQQSEQRLFTKSLGQSDMNLSTASRMASSKVPWNVYENLKLLYGILLGQSEEILMTAQDWLEGTIYLAVWWDGSNQEGLDTSLNKSSIRKSTTQKPRDVDITPLEAYRRRLADAFARVTEDPEDTVFTVNTMDLVEVATACVLEDSVGAVISILRTWSMPVTVSVVELAYFGKWLPSNRPMSRGGLFDAGFSREDLMLLSTGPSNQTVQDGTDPDEVLSQYADLLSRKQQVGDREGWELAVAVLNRLEQSQDAGKKIGELLDRLELTEEARVDKVLQVCDELGQTEQRRGIAERFADSLAEQGSKAYGSALIYYARAHAESKLKSTVSLLVELCLLHSAAMPAEALLDTKLEGLLGVDRPALKELSRTDLDAASLLSSQLSGYATLRKFYDLRDQDVYATIRTPMGRPLKSLERRRAAASSLVAVIRSAADCISGGLFDPDIESVIPADGLLTLLGEALPLLGQDQRIFTQEQVFALLAVVEDFSASPSRIRENADSLLASSLNAYMDETSTASGILKKSRSELGGSSWDLLAISSTELMTRSQKGKKQAKLERAWDWRQGLVGMGGIEDPDAKMVVKLVREALVREVAGGWGGRLNW